MTCERSVAFVAKFGACVSRMRMFVDAAPRRCSTRSARFAFFEIGGGRPPPRAAVNDGAATALAAASRLRVGGAQATTSGMNAGALEGTQSVALELMLQLRHGSG